MKLGRIFANAVARRIAYVLVAAILTAAGIGSARAATCGIPSKADVQLSTGSTQTYEYEGQARAACESATRWHGNPISGVIYVMQKSGACVAAGTGGKQFSVAASSEAAGGERYNTSGCTRMSNSVFGTDTIQGWTWTTPGCPPGESPNPDGTCAGCDDRPPLSGVNGQGANAFEVCDNECRFECGGVGLGGVVIDGSPMTVCTVPWTPTGAQCSTSGPGGLPGTTPAPTDTDGDGISDDNDSSPNNPGQGGAGDDGETADEDSDCGGPGQPVCGAAGAGSGNGNTSGGGGDCNTPPTSTGDPILAQIAFQTWATRCAITGTANGGSGTGDGDGEGSGDQPDWTKGDGPDPNTDENDYLDETRAFGIGISTDMLDTENIFGEASCPQFPSFPIMGVEISTASWPFWCEFVSIMRACVLLVGAFTALGILMGRVV